jgi:hypothetical protein
VSGVGPIVAATDTRQLYRQLENPPATA